MTGRVAYESIYRLIHLVSNDEKVISHRLILSPPLTATHCGNQKERAFAKKPTWQTKTNGSHIGDT